MHLEFPDLAEDLRKNGYIKKLIVGEELFEKHRNPKLQALFARAKKGYRTITDRASVNQAEYFAESFAAAHLHPSELDNRDPEMGEFIEKFLARKGMGKP